MPKMRLLTTEEKQVLDIPEKYSVQENYVPDVGKKYYSVRDKEFQRTYSGIQTLEDVKDLINHLEEKDYIAAVEEYDQPIAIIPVKGDVPYYWRKRRLMVYNPDDENAPLAIAHEIGHQQDSSNSDKITSEINAWSFAMEKRIKSGAWNESEKEESIDALSTYYMDDDGLNYVGAKNKARNMIDMIEEYRMKYSK